MKKKWLIIGLIARVIGKMKKQSIQVERNDKNINEANNDINNIMSNTEDQIRIQLNPTGAWKDFLENQIGASGKGKTLKDLRKK